MPPTDPAARPDLPGEESSARLASLAARILQQPETATLDEIKSLAASVLTQAPPSAGGRADREEEDQPAEDGDT